MKTKATILNLVAFIGVLGSFYLSGLNAFSDWSFMPRSYSFSIPENDPISQALGYIYPALSFIFFGSFFSGAVLFCCSAIAVTLKLKVVSNGYGIAFDVPRNSKIKERIMPSKDYLEIGKALDQQSAEGFSVYQAELSSMHRDLTALGKKLQKEGLINPSWGDSHSRAALDFLLKEYGVDPVSS